MISHRLIYAYYIGNEFSKIHELHLKLLSIYINEFDNVDFILLFDDENSIDETVSIIKSYINRQDINFITLQNNSMYREGIVYKSYVIDRLDEFEENELVFFGHTKGVTNELNKTYDANTRLWIELMYWGNLEKIYIVNNELLINDNVCFGTIYNYDESSLVKYKWQYTGSFQWINPKRLYNIVKDDQKMYTDYNIKCIAEEFLGNNVDIDKVAFNNHTWFNKKHSLLLYEKASYPYENMEYLAYTFMSIDDIYEFEDFIKTYNLNK